MPDVTDLHAAIRAQLDRWDNHLTAFGGHLGFDEMTTAIGAVLDLHGRDDRGRCIECREGGPGYEAEPMEHPCPTTKTIAEKLGIPT